jgi:predicted nucleic acid-binding protein
MTTFTVVFDACVLYPAPLRDFLLHLACAGVFRARWSDEIHDEWIRNLLANRSDLTAEQLRRTRELMNSAVPDSLVTGHLGIAKGLILPDPDDTHVLAAAICSNAQVIVTFNLKDFPNNALSPYGINAQHPDDFVRHLISLDWGAVCGAFKRQRASLKNPPQTAEQLLDTLERGELVISVSELRPLLELL